MKTNHLTLAELIRIAVLMEERGASYYSSLREKVSDPKIKEVLHRLAEDEKLHARQFIRILGGSSDLAAAPISTATRDYLEALSGKGFFKDPSKREEAFVPQDRNQALALGIEAEKDSILFYHELYQELPPGEVRDAVSKLLREEKMHLVELRSIIEDKY